MPRNPQHNKISCLLQSLRQHYQCSSYFRRFYSNLQYLLGQYIRVGVITSILLVTLGLSSTMVCMVGLNMTGNVKYVNSFRAINVMSEQHTAIDHDNKLNPEWDSALTGMAIGYSAGQHVPIVGPITGAFLGMFSGQKAEKKLKPLPTDTSKSPL